MEKLKSKKKVEENAWNDKTTKSSATTNKRKTKLKLTDNSIPIKKSKQLQEDNGKLSDEEEIREPTMDEVKESEKPECIYSVKSGRTKKKEKHIKKLEEKKSNLFMKDVKKNQEYLTKWLNNRSEWKFEKLRQISIQLTIFDDIKMNEDFWPIALKYLSSSKGQSKEKIIKLAENEIDKLDLEMTKTKNKELVNNVKYIRAREMLQSFN